MSWLSAISPERMPGEERIRCRTSEGFFLCPLKLVSGLAGAATVWKPRFNSLHTIAFQIAEEPGVREKGKPSWGSRWRSPTLQ